MTKEEFLPLEQKYQQAIINFLQKKREELIGMQDYHARFAADTAKQAEPFYDKLHAKIKNIEGAVEEIFKEEEQKISKKPSFAKTNDIPTKPKTSSVPTVLYPEDAPSPSPILVENLNLSLFLTFRKNKEARSIPIGYLLRQSNEDIITFLTLYAKAIDVGFGLDYNELPWNIDQHNKSYQFDSTLIEAWFQGIKKILQSQQKEKIPIHYWEKSEAYIQRLDDKYILLEDPGSAPLIQITLSDLLPSMLTACTEYLSFLNRIEPLLIKLLQQKTTQLNPDILNALDAPHFRIRVRHLRRNLYSSSSF